MWPGDDDDDAFVISTLVFSGSGFNGQANVQEAEAGRERGVG